MQSSILHPKDYTYWAKNRTYYNKYAPWYTPHLEVFRNGTCWNGTADIIIPVTKYVLPYLYTYEEDIGVWNAKIPTIQDGDSVWFVNPFNQTACLWKDGYQKKHLVACINGDACTGLAHDQPGGPYNRAIIVATPDLSEAMTVVANGAAAHIKLNVVVVLVSALSILALLLQ